MQLKFSPAVSAVTAPPTTGAGSGTSTGTTEYWGVPAVPVPNCPYWFEPQQKSFASAKAHVDLFPVRMVVTVRPSSTPGAATTAAKFTPPSTPIPTSPTRLTPPQ